MFDCLDATKEALNSLRICPSCIAEIQTAIEWMWSKLRDYYDKSGKPFAVVDATLLHPALKVSFMKKCGYDDKIIENYKTEAQNRFNEYYDVGYVRKQPTRNINSTRNNKRLHSDTDSSDDEAPNEFSQYLALKREKAVKDPLKWWQNSHSIFPKASKMARDVFAVSATGAGVEREFSIAGRVVTKQRNRLNPQTIRDLMQYKRWLARHSPHKVVSSEGVEVEEDDQESILVDDEEVNKELTLWLKEWEKKERIAQRILRLSQL